MHPRRFFQRRVHAAIGRDDHDEGDGRKPEPLDPTHADERRDVEGRLSKPNKLDEKFIDDADARMQQKHPAHGGEKRRHQRADSHEGED